MAAEVGTAYVSIIPETRRFGSLLSKQITSPVRRQGVTSGKSFGSAFGLGLKSIGAGLAVLGVGAIAKQAVDLEASFSQTMNTIAAVTNTPRKGIKALSDLALKFGQDTVFSASEAANAMLELAKGGLTLAQIRGGALAQTLTLAAAGGTDLATAATIMSNAMNTFGLSAKDTPKITAALAGGANASTASIESLGEALQQVGPGAKTAGLSVNDTVAALAAFDNAGIKGSDAGTSLKTMLTRLIPQGKRAAGAMEVLGLKFTDAQGKFLPLTEIAGRLKAALAGLSDAQKSDALSKIFGSAATRAASVLADLGSRGIGGYIKATKDLDAAQRISKARMEGTAGAIERLKGSFETAKLSVGQSLAPATQSAADTLTAGLNKAAAKIPVLMAKLSDPTGKFQTEILPRMRSFGNYLKDKFFPALGDFAKTTGPELKSTLSSIVGSLTELMDTFKSGDGSGATFGDNLVTAINTTALVVNAELKLMALNVRILTTAFKVFTFIPRTLAGFGAQLLAFLVKPFLNATGAILTASAKAFGWIPGIGPKLKTAAAKFAIFKTQVFASLTGFKQKGLDLGAQFAAGLAIGIASNNPRVTKANAVGTANKIAAGLRSGRLLDGSRADVRAAGGGAGGTINVYNPLPERTSESVDRALRRKRRLAGIPVT